ncbi:MAG: hypothetical protein RM368_31215 [Nostoc sp. DedSLP03]|nr:hypothetical protein [Nostoc sp. DedSLP03]MDZ7969366.1 hypothetical protein [Nostoc sp. DedSLP03]
MTTYRAIVPGISDRNSYSISLSFFAQIRSSPSCHKHKLAYNR